MALERFCLTVSLANPSAVMLLVFIEVGGWGCPNLARHVRMGHHASFVVKQAGEFGFGRRRDHFLHDVAHDIYWGVAHGFRRQMVVLVVVLDQMGGRAGNDNQRRWM